MMLGLSSNLPDLVPTMRSDIREEKRVWLDIIRYQTKYIRIEVTEAYITYISLSRS